MLVTICLIRQLPQAFTLGDSFVQYNAGADSTVLIGLADDPANLPAGFQSPFPLLPVSELMTAEQLENLSATYTPTEFAAACKPLLLAEAFRRYPDVTQLLYADPNIQFLAPLTPVWQRLAEANGLLTPFITQRLHDAHQPDEKHLQNVGLYSADFLAFRRSAETDQLLGWWQDRVMTRAYVQFCEGLCLDQLWLMHVPVFFKGVAVVKELNWHVGLWNLPWRKLDKQQNDWFVKTDVKSGQPLLFANFKGLFNPDEGLFGRQTRLQLSNRPDVTLLLTTYRKAVAQNPAAALQTVKPAYGRQPEPVVLRGWRHTTVTTLRAFNRFIDRIPLPAIR